MNLTDRLCILTSVPVRGLLLSSGGYHIHSLTHHNSNIANTHCTWSGKKQFLKQGCILRLNKYKETLRVSANKSKLFYKRWGQYIRWTLGQITEHWSLHINIVYLCINSLVCVVLFILDFNKCNSFNSFRTEITSHARQKE